MVTGSTIVGLGRYVPQRVLTNAELAPQVESTDEWIRSHTGIGERGRLIAAVGEEKDEHLAHERVVLDDQDMGLHGFG